MSAMAFVGPVKDVDAAREFATALKGERRTEWLASQRRTGCIRERICLGDSPSGATTLVYREGENAGFHMAQLMASSNAFDRFFVESVSRVAGTDVTSLPAGPPAHLAFEWTSGERARSCTMFAAPTPDETKLWSFCRAISSRPGEHAESRQRHGIVFEQSFYIRQSKMLVVYLEGADPHHALGEMMHSTSDYDRWFAEQAGAVHGVDLRSMPMKAPELLVLFDA